MKKLAMAVAAVALMAPAAIGFDGHGGAAHFEAAKMEKILSTRDDAMKARYQYRHPKETLEFFGVAPGMTVADLLPGQHWYSGILLPYLGKDGQLVGTDYAEKTWVGYQAGEEGAAEWVAKRTKWPEEWAERAEGWRQEGDAKVSAMAIDKVPGDLVGKIDVFMMMRALHLPNRFDGELGSLLANAYKALKPGGTLGIVQHRAPESSSDAWATGGAGYLKQSALIAAVKAAGFEFVASSEVNANAKDKPTEQDVVWRLPPAFGGSADDAEKRAAMQAIGESDRMTLKFRKPA